MVVLSTASPYKFPAAVSEALGLPSTGDQFQTMEDIQRSTGVPMPANLQGLRQRPRLHLDCVTPEKMENYVIEKAAEATWKK